MSKVYYKCFYSVLKETTQRSSKVTTVITGKSHPLRP